MDSDLKVEELDLYEILGVEATCTISEIKTAYRKKALKCHPDKNPDNPDANREFHKLLKVLEILSDEAARSAYDKVLKGRKEAALRHRELDGKRRKLKEDLEAREKYYADHSKQSQQKTADQQLQEEIERLRKEGSKLLEEEMEYVRQKLREESLSSTVDWDSAKHRIKIKWKAEKHDESNGGYSYEMLHRFLLKYGEIEALVMSPRKKGSALVEFTTKNAAEMAVELEIGLPDNPIKLEWVHGPPTSFKRSSNLVKDSDFESVVLTKMRQAEERKRLIAQMMAEDETNT